MAVDEQVQDPGTRSRSGRSAPAYSGNSSGKCGSMTPVKPLSFAQRMSSPPAAGSVKLIDAIMANRVTVVANKVDQPAVVGVVAGDYMGLVAHRLA